MHAGLNREGPLVMTSKYIQGYTSDQVDLGVKADLFGAVALVVIRNHAVQRVL